MLSYGNVRPRVALVALILLSCATCWATSALQSDMDNVLRSDPRNSGILVSVGVRDGGSSLVYNLTSVGPTNSMSDVFRIFSSVRERRKGTRLQGCRIERARPS